MNKDASFLGRLIAIAVTLALLIAVVVFVGEKIRNSAEVKAHQKVEVAQSLKPMNFIEKSHHKPNRVSFTSPAKSPILNGAQRRSMETYYSRRAYPGAPPAIPHAVSKDMQIQQNCNTCHEKGGYVPAMQAFTPITPHPEYRNCLQCHGLGETDSKFVANDWKTIKVPELKRPALPGGPPQIPHSLQLRENCIACHGGAAAPTKIYCPHPERVSCVQCHTPNNSKKPFSRLKMENEK